MNTKPTSIPVFEKYQPRNISFLNIEKSAGWYVKVYTITNRLTFSSHATLKRAIDQLPVWLEMKSDLPDYKMAFLIAHEAREGVWILLNYWVGGEMIETLTFFSDKETPDHISKSPNPHALICVWELEILTHERQAWIQDVLLNPKNPQFEHYLTNVLSHAT